MSFYTSLSGLKNAQTDLGVISHNIANAETNGFKKARPVSQTLSPIRTKPIRAWRSAVGRRWN